MKQPSGFVVHGEIRKVCRFRKSLYGLKNKALEHGLKNSVKRLRSLACRKANLIIMSSIEILKQISSC